MKINEKKIETVEERIPLIIAIANKILKDINFVEEIDEKVDWDKSKSLLSPGILGKAFILSTFFEIRAPLVRISERFREIDTEYLFGEGVTKEYLSSFNLGRMLDKISKNKNLTNLYKLLAIKAYTEFNVRIKKLHADTTTISFYGEYDKNIELLSEEEKEEYLNITRGYNKDGRPECNQVVVGQITNEDGVPIISEVMDGNTSDIKWNEKAIEYVRDLQKDIDSGVILVADSKLITHDLVEKMMSEENFIGFVSRCPSGYEGKIESRVIEEALKNGDCWEDYGTFYESEKACHYYGKEIDTKLFKDIDPRLRFLVVRSSSLECKADKKIVKEREKFKHEIKAVEKIKYACKEDAEKEWQRFSKNKRFKLFDCIYEIETIENCKKAKGRPSISKPKPDTVTFEYKLKISIVENEEKINTYRNTESVFVIISNADKDKYRSKDLLETYKGQFVVETSFRYFKEPTLASVIFLKNTDRIKAMCFLLSISLLLRGLIQFRLREGLKEHNETNPNEDLKIGWNKRKLVSPTYRLLFESIKNNYFLKVNSNEYDFNYDNEYNQYLVKNFLGLLKVSLAELLS